MKSMKKILLALVVALSASILQAEYLYWMVDLAEKTPENQFYYATVTLDGNLLSNVSASDPSIVGELVQAEGTPPSYSTGQVYAEFTSGSSFLFEIWKDSNASELLGYQTISYDALSAQGHIYKDPQSKTTPYVVMSVVPEPTSGLLMLFGLAGLALRRRGCHS